MLHQNLIAGEWAEGVAVNRNINPSNLDDTVGEYARADARQAEQAIDAAHEAFKGWSRATPEERSDVLDRIGAEILARKDELGRLLSREEGKTLPEGVGEAVRAGRIFKFFAGEAFRVGGEKIPSVRAGVEVEITREPEGVVGIITPWNFPFLIASERVPWAIGAGCTVVLKPSEFTSGTSVRMAELAREAGIPDGVFNVVTGYGDPAGQVLAEDPRTDMVAFTGSVRVGTHLAAIAA